MNENEETQNLDLMKVKKEGENENLETENKEDNDGDKKEEADQFHEINQTISPENKTDDNFENEEENKPNKTDDLPNSDETKNNDENIVAANNDEKENKENEDSLNTNENTQQSLPPTFEQNKKKQHEDEISAQANRILSGEQDCLDMDSNDVMPIIAYLTNYRNQKMEEHDVDEAEKSDFYITKIIDNHKNEIKCAVQKKHQQEMFERLEKAQIQLNDLEKSSKISIQKLEEEDKKMLEQLKIKQEKEIEELINKFNSPVVQRHYTQASSNLRKLRTQTVLLRQAKRFDELRIAERWCVQQEKIETSQAHKNMSLELENQIKILEQKHKTELQHHLIAIEDKETRLKIVCDRKIQASKRRIENIQTELNQLQYTENVWNRHHRNEIISVSNRGNTAKGARNLKTRSTQRPAIFDLKLPPLVPAKKQTQRSRKSVSYKV